MSDAVYKKLYSFDRMVADLLRAAAPGIAQRLDLDTLEDLSPEFVGERNQQRRGDKVWRARLDGPGIDGRWLHVLVLLEFQSDKAGGAMPLRALEYAVLLLGELNRTGELGPPGAWPATLPIVLYNGEAPWSGPLDVRELFGPVGDELAPYLPSQRLLLVDELRVNGDDMPPANLTRAVVGFEQSRSPADLAQVVDALDGWLAPREAELRRAFAGWVRDMAAVLAPGQEPVPAITKLEGARMSLVERIAEWPKQWVEQGREIGIDQGREMGIEQGLANERALLRRQASARFDGAVGARLESALASESDPQRLADVGEWIVTCSTSAELETRLATLPLDSPSSAQGAT